MAGQLTETEINIRKQTLSAELEKQSLHIKLEEQRTNITAQMCTTGAIQQCDLFLQQLNGGNEDVASGIPSEPEGFKQYRHGDDLMVYRR